MSVIEEKDRYVVENPADKLLPEEEVKEIVGIYRSEREKALECYIGQKYENGFSINEDMAMRIVRGYAPEKVGIQADNYTLCTIGKVTMLIARDKDMIVKYTVEMPVEVATKVEGSHFEETLEQLREENREYKKVQVVGNILMGITIGIVSLLVIFILYMNYGGMLWG